MDSPYENLARMSEHRWWISAVRFAKKNASTGECMPKIYGSTVSLAWLAKKDPDNWGNKKKIEITSIATIIPDSGRLTEDEWLAKYGNKANKLTQKTKPIDAQSVEVKSDETN